MSTEQWCGEQFLDVSVPFTKTAVGKADNHRLTEPGEIIKFSGDMVKFSSRPHIPTPVLSEVIGDVDVYNGAVIQLGGRKIVNVSFIVPDRL